MENERAEEKPLDDEMGGPPRIEPEKLSAAELLREIGARVAALARDEVELARAELRSDVRAELQLAKGLLIAGVAALAGLNLLLLAAVFALARAMPDWAAALCGAALCLAVTAIAGAIAWRGRVRTPLARTRRTLEEDVEWAREQIR